MKPTIGRIVHFVDRETSNHCPAIIVNVWSDTCVNLKVFKTGSLPIDETSCVLGESSGTWHWPERD